MDGTAAHRDDIRDFLVSRRARLLPEQVGLPAGPRRRVAGLRREEVAVLSGVSTEWYIRLERGNIAGVSEDVLDAVARALRLTDDERGYLFDLAEAARSERRIATRARDTASSIPAGVDGPVQWLIDSVTESAVFLRNGRLDLVATNALGRALHAPMLESPTAKPGLPNFARFHFLDPVARDFFVDWQGGAAATVALLRAEAGRHPGDRVLRALVGELSTASQEFRTLWAAHDVRSRHEGVKQLQHPVVGFLELTYQSAELADQRKAARFLNLYTAAPGSTHADRLRVLASWSADARSSAALAE